MSVLSGLVLSGLQLGFQVLDFIVCTALDGLLLSVAYFTTRCCCRDSL